VTRRRHHSAATTTVERSSLSRRTELEPADVVTVPLQTLRELTHKALLASLHFVWLSTSLDEHALGQCLLDRNFLHGIGAKTVQDDPTSRAVLGAGDLFEHDHLARCGPETSSGASALRVAVPTSGASAW
jgi:hypothetical protein